MKNVPKNLRFEVSPEEFREHLKRVERIEKELIIDALKQIKEEKEAWK
jgi:hypothetical protein